MKLKKSLYGLLQSTLFFYEKLADNLEENSFKINLYGRCVDKKYVVTRNFRISRGGRLLLDGNTKGCESAEHIAKNVEVNQRMCLTLENKNPF